MSQFCDKQNEDMFESLDESRKYLDKELINWFDNDEKIKKYVSDYDEYLENRLIYENYLTKEHTFYKKMLKERAKNISNKCPLCRS